MKIRILPALVAGVMATTAFLSSCLKSNYAEIDYPVESSIKAFSIGTLRQTIYGKDSEGNDSIYTDTISYAHVPFTIDQINRQIYWPLSRPTMLLFGIKTSMTEIVFGPQPIPWISQMR